MKKLLIIAALVTAVCALVLTACGSSSVAAASQVADPSITFVVLDSNPTTGYSWRFKTVPESQLVINQISDYFEAPKTNRVGVGGEHIFVWQAVNAGEAEILGFHMRPWARSKEEPSVTYKIIVR